MKFRIAISASQTILTILTLNLLVSLMYCTLSGNITILNIKSAICLYCYKHYIFICS